MMTKIFFLKSFLTTKLITLLYWILLLFSLAGGLIVMNLFDGFVGILIGLIAMAGCMLLSRVISEMLSVFFLMYENLKEINQTLKTE